MNSSQNAPWIIGPAAVIQPPVNPIHRRGSHVLMADCRAVLVVPNDAGEDIWWALGTPTDESVGIVESLR